MQWESDLVEDDGRNGKGQKQEAKWNQQEPQKPHTPEINHRARQQQDERKSLGVELSACNACPESEKTQDDRRATQTSRRFDGDAGKLFPLSPKDIADNEWD